MGQIPVRNINGETVGEIELDETVFGIQPNEAVVHQALVRQRANARAGTANTKTRAEVVGSSRKLFRQKHTGFARAGSRRSPLRRGGGVVFGPSSRDYRQAMPKKMRRLALKSVLSSKVADGELLVIDTFQMSEPATKQVVNMLRSLGVQSSALLVTAEPDVNVVKSARNVPKTRTLTANMLNVLDLLTYRVVIITVDAVRRAEAIWGKAPAVAEPQA